MNWRAVEAAATAKGISIDELHRRGRAAAQEESSAASAIGNNIIVEEVKDQVTRRATDGDEGPIGDTATGESLDPLSSVPNMERVRREDGSSRVSGEEV